MTEEQKQLLIKDLCCRLPYRVKARFPDYYGGYFSAIEDIDIDGYAKDFEGEQHEIDDIKPYLFPLSSMTEEQRNMLEDWDINEPMLDISGERQIHVSLNLRIIDWLNAHHFDYRGLIEQGLAIDATGLNIY